RARFAREHVEPTRERERERLDDREVADAKLGQHGSLNMAPSAARGFVAVEQPSPMQLLSHGGKEAVLRKPYDGHGERRPANEERFAGAEHRATLSVDRHQKLARTIVRLQGHFGGGRKHEWT